MGDCAMMCIVMSYVFHHFFFLVWDDIPSIKSFSTCAVHTPTEPHVDFCLQITNTAPARRIPG